MESKRSCAIVQDLLPVYVDGMAKPETTAFVDAHLTECESCRRACRAMSGTLPKEAVEAEDVVRRLKKARQRRILTLWGIAAAVLLIAAILLLPMPRRFRTTHEGLLWRCSAPDEAQTTTVTLTGTYWDFLLRQDSFAGSILVDALPQTQGDLSILNMGNGQYGVWYENEEARMKSLGTLYVRKDGSVMLLLHEEGHWDAENGLMLSAPAANREEAVALANELAQELSPNWLGKWTFR